MQGLEPTTDSDVTRYKFSGWRKCLLLAGCSFTVFTSASALSSIFPATAHVALELSTTAKVLNIANACVQVAMGLSVFVWQPVQVFIRRRNAFLLALLILLCFSIGAARATSTGMFIAMRIIVGSTGTFFLLAGQEILAETFEPVIRGTAFGSIQIGNTAGMTIGPCIGGAIVYYTHWRVIYWVQVGLAGLSLILSFFSIPSEKEMSNHQPKARGSKSATMNPLRVLKPLLYPNVLITDVACGLLCFFQFVVLTSIPNTLNPRFNLTSPLVSGLFYLAPFGGFALGSLAGGVVSDRTTRRYIKKRGGVRLPQDRLNGALPIWLGLLPVSMLIYGWTLDKKVGGMAVPIISIFFVSCGIVVAFNGLNTYCAETLPEQRSAVISGKYVVQYSLGAVSTGAVVPMIDAMGVGLVFTICTIVSFVGGVSVFLVARYGLQMQKYRVSRRA
ncbi:MFS transporter [Aspergillus taichungensis]|uniref:MFS transporter n=1 Tax=Aspergillus taichungensis TaxID=482145 RepID=A0A2J5I1A0_9EURO|nr:MFS transporter [Aspergillus taichungensis]